MLSLESLDRSWCGFAPYRDIPSGDAVPPVTDYDIVPEYPDKEPRHQAMGLCRESKRPIWAGRLHMMYPQDYLMRGNSSH